MPWGLLTISAVVVGTVAVYGTWVAGTTLVGAGAASVVGMAGWPCVQPGAMVLLCCLAKRARTWIRPARAGRVSALTAVAGQSITAGTALATLLPAEADASALVAHLYAPSRTAGFVEPGQQVGLRYAAYPYQKFGMHVGRVTTVSRTPVNPQDLPPGRAQALMAASGGQEPLYRVTVALASQTISTYGTPQPLKSGMAVEAQLQQGQRAIWEWVLEPVLAVWKSRP